MEDTHWDPAVTNKEVCEHVLILVLMEDTHWELTTIAVVYNRPQVLILVLMEDTHWVSLKW